MRIRIGKLFCVGSLLTVSHRGCRVFCDGVDLVVRVVAHMPHAAAAYTYPSIMSSFSRIRAAAPLYVYLVAAIVALGNGQVVQDGGACTSRTNCKTGGQWTSGACRTRCCNSAAFGDRNCKTCGTNGECTACRSAQYALQSDGAFSVWRGPCSIHSTLTLSVVFCFVMMRKPWRHNGVGKRPCAYVCTLAPPAPQYRVENVSTSPYASQRIRDSQ